MATTAQAATAVSLVATGAGAAALGAPALLPVALVLQKAVIFTNIGGAPAHPILAGVGEQMQWVQGRFGLFNPYSKDAASRRRQLEEDSNSTFLAGALERLEAEAAIREMLFTSLIDCALFLVPFAACHLVLLWSWRGCVLCRRRRRRFSQRGRVQLSSKPKRFTSKRTLRKQVHDHAASILASSAAAALTAAAQSVVTAAANVATGAMATLGLAPKQAEKSIQSTTLFQRSHAAEAEDTDVVEAIINVAENITGLDLDGDGDVGMAGHHNQRVAAQKKAEEERARQKALAAEAKSQKATAAAAAEAAAEEKAHHFQPTAADATVLHLPAALIFPNLEVILLVFFAGGITEAAAMTVSGFATGVVTDGDLFAIAIAALCFVLLFYTGEFYRLHRFSMRYGKALSVPSPPIKTIDEVDDVVLHCLSYAHLFKPRPRFRGSLQPAPEDEKEPQRTLRALDAARHPLRQAETAGDAHGRLAAAWLADVSGRRGVFCEYFRIRTHIPCCSLLTSVCSNLYSGRSLHPLAPGAARRLCSRLQRQRGERHQPRRTSADPDGAGGAADLRGGLLPRRERWGRPP